ncbi:MAG: BrnT family toxin [Polyangiaceae bacterium]
MRFEWDRKKEQLNVAKHGVSFREAKELFTSKGDFLELYDGEHSELEERFIAIGPIRRGLVLVVYTERNEDTVRIISARWATKEEQALFLEYMEERS